jgi:transposase
MKTKLTISAAEIERLENMIKSGSAKAREIKHAQVLLKLSRGWKQQDIAKACDLHPRTIIRVRNRCLKEGLEAALVDKPRSGAPKRIEGDQKALIVATACTTPPKGHSRWSLRLLADKMVELEVLETISHTAIATILKKTN